MEILAFEEDVYKFVKPSYFINDVHTNFYWRKLFRCLFENKHCVNNLDLLHTRCKFLLNRLTELGCNEKDIVSRIIKTYSLWCWHGSRMDKMVDNPMLIGEVVDCVLGPLDLDNEGHDRPYLTDVEKVDLCIEIADVDFMKVLIMYGVTDVTRDICYYEFRQAEISLLTFWLYTEKNELGGMDHQDLHSYIRLAKSLLCELRASHGQLGSANKRGFTRILQIARILKAITPKEQGNTSVEDCVKCLRLYYRTTQEPFVSKYDIQDFLMYLYDDEVCDKIVERITESFDDLFFPESTLPYSPRTLMHLCRCSVRKSLIRRSDVLPLVVGRLDIPSTLKDYLLGKY